MIEPRFRRDFVKAVEMVAGGDNIETADDLVAIGFDDDVAARAIRWVSDRLTESAKKTKKRTNEGPRFPKFDKDGNRLCQKCGDIIPKTAKPYVTLCMTCFRMLL